MILVLGFVVFGEIPDGPALAGIVRIAGAGLALVLGIPAAGFGVANPSSGSASICAARAWSLVSARSRVSRSTGAQGASRLS